jgi:arylsulfatase A-like enzyme
MKSIAPRLRTHRAAALAFACLIPLTLVPAADERPNILWVTSEDNGPELGCYGDPYASTPNIDALAAKGFRYLNAWSTAPVCAPARTTLISGLYPPCTGSEHMRSMAQLPERFHFYPDYLRKQGYYCINPGKTDYNLSTTEKEWDQNVPMKTLAEKSAAGTPFLAVYNFTVSHESQIRTRPHKQIHDPAMAPLPPYHPDTPEVRQDWAQYYDKMSEMDAQVGAKIRELEAAGLADNTILFYYGDHGSGMPRSKRYPYNSGLRVPLVIHVPEKFKHLAPADYIPGGKTDRLVGFIDYAPTLVSIAGAEPPAHFQGHAFMGAHAAPEQDYIFGFRGRMDERYDLIRTVRDKRYQYLRNFMPHKIYGQHVGYMFETPTTRVWNQLFLDGKLDETQSAFWKTKAPEELYDLETDPYEIHNLANAPEHQETLARLRAALHGQMLAIRDVGLLPEGDIHRRAIGSTPYDMGHDPKKYPLEDILATAEKASSLREDATAELAAELAAATDDAVRYWAAMGLLMRGKTAVEAHADVLRRALEDSSPYVRVATAEALGTYGSDEDIAAALKALGELAPPVGGPENNGFLAIAALNAIDALGPKADPLKALVASLPNVDPGVPNRSREYPKRLIETIVPKGKAGESKKAQRQREKAARKAAP